jgi:serine/threonine protein kinase
MLGSAEECNAIFHSHALNISTLSPTGAVLGEGFFGCVLLAELTAPLSGTHPASQSGGKRGVRPQSRRPVAVKVVKTGVGSDANRTTVQALLEARLLAVMQHPHLVQLLGVCMTRMPVQLVLEYCEWGNLRNYLRDGGARREGLSSIVAMADMGTQAASAVAYLHSKLCLHRDLAARNILVARPSPDALPAAACGVHLKLSDLGLSRLLANDDDYYKVSRGG